MNYDEWNLSELYDYIKTLDETIRKTVIHEATLTKVSYVLRHALSSALKGERLTTLFRLMDFRRALVPLVPFYDWARDILLTLPTYEADIWVKANPSVPIHNLLAVLTERIGLIRAMRDAAQKELPPVEYAIRTKTAILLRRQRKEEE